MPRSIRQAPQRIGRIHHRAVVAALFSSFSAAAAAAHLPPSATQWQPLVIDVAGPAASESDLSPHPFLDYRLDVTFTSPTGNAYVVPGFFAGNGRGFGTGNIWRSRFTPDEPGTWRWSVSFVTAPDIAVAEPGEIVNASPVSEHGATGDIEVAERDDTAPGFLADGRLEYVGEHYLKQADGDYWIKGGVDSPENFFGYAGFDNTLDQPGGIITRDLVDGVHRYDAHVDDWRSGDPEFTSATTGVDSRGIVGAINYLSAQGVNSIYFLPMNLGGDGQETYPFVGPSGSDFDNTHYDISKLHQWNQVLNHMQERGIAAHIVLAEQETENTEWLDNGELGTQRKLYFRELVARFAYLNGIKWNLSEESRFGSDLEMQMAQQLRTLDWANHPIAVHTNKDKVAARYEPLLGSIDFDATSIQFSAENAEDITETWRTRTQEAGLPWVIDLDEVGPAGVGLSDTNIDTLRLDVLYPVYFSGGNIEWYFGRHRLPLGGDLETEDFRPREPMYRYMRIARDFLQRHLDLDRAEPLDQLLSGGTVEDQVFGDINTSLVAWLPDGRGDRNIDLGDDPTGRWSVQWYEPLTGNAVSEPVIRAGSTLSIGEAPGDTTADWFVHLARLDDVTPEPEPVVQPAAAVAAVDPHSESAAPELGAADETPEETGEGSEPAATTTTTESSAKQGGGGAALAALMLLLAHALTRRATAQRSRALVVGQLDDIRVDRTRVIPVRPEHHACSARADGGVRFTEVSVV